MAGKARTELTTGQKIGDLTLRRRSTKKSERPNLRKRWRCECVCGTFIIVPEYYLKRKPNPKSHCGCRLKTNKTIHNTVYRIWLMMHQRCYNPTHVAYHHYGGRGITICDRWHKDVSGDQGFENFLADVGPRPLPHKKWSIDRINNDTGYSPDNVRWATAKQQRANQRKPKRKKAP